MAATVAAGVLTLTAADASDHSVNVYRLDAGHVEIDGVAGTTINGAAFQVLNLSAVNGIRVNLGAGYDTYHIYSASGNPALNIGAGGILFQGLGGTGDDLPLGTESPNWAGQEARKEKVAGKTCKCARKGFARDHGGPTPGANCHARTACYARQVRDKL